jgi:undecaprenyl-diphosphatase
MVKAQIKSTSARTPEVIQPPVSARSARWLWPALSLGALSACGVAALIVEELAEGDTFRFDSAILLALRQPGNVGVAVGPAWVLQSAIDLSALGGFTLLWLLGSAALASMIYSGRRAEAALIGASVVGASVINAILKIVLNRARPDVVPHLAVVSNASFPSGHAMISAAVYLTVGIMLAETQTRAAPRAYIVGFAGLLVFLIGCSRVYLGVHWPSDVLAGWCFGTVWALALFAANRLIHRLALRM